MGYITPPRPGAASRVAEVLFQLVQLAIVHIRPDAEGPHTAGFDT